MFDQYDDILSTDEACEVLKVGKNSLYRMLCNGEIKAMRCGRVWKIPRAAITEYVLRSCGIKKA